MFEVLSAKGALFMVCVWTIKAGPYVDNEALLGHQRVQPLARVPGPGQHRQEILLPEETVALEDLVHVAEQSLCLDLERERERERKREREKEK